MITSFMWMGNEDYTLLEVLAMLVYWTLWWQQNKTVSKNWKNKVLALCVELFVHMAEQLLFGALSLCMFTVLQNMIVCKGDHTVLQKHRTGCRTKSS